MLMLIIKHYVEILLIQVYSKICDHSSYTQSIIKKITFLSSVRMSGKNVNFEDKKNQESDFCKNKNATKTLSDTMMMMLLDHYA